jgi:Phage gp6-like head-tail connector protein
MPYLSRIDALTTPILPISVALARQHTRIDSTYDDSLLSVYIASATAACQTFLNRSLITQTLQYSLVRTTEANSWPLAPAPLFVLPLGLEYVLRHLSERDIGLPRGPVQSVTSVATGSWGEADTELVLDTDYNIDLTCDPARIHLINGNSWEYRDHITIVYVAGYGADFTTIPPPIIHALLLATASFYQHRGEDGGGELPTAAENLMWPYRIMTFGET